LVCTQEFNLQKWLGNDQYLKTIVETTNVLTSYSFGKHTKQHTRTPKTKTKQVQYADFQEAQEALSPDQAKLLALEVM
jgi:hypothetical protein